MEQSGQNAYSTHTDVAEITATYLSWLDVRGCRPRTLSTRRQNLEFFVEFMRQQHLSDGKLLDLSLIDSAVIAEYQRFLYENGSPRTGRDLSARMQHNVLSGLKSFFEFLRLTERIIDDPTKGLHLPKCPQKLPEGIMSTDEVERLLEVPNVKCVTGFRDRAMMELLYSSGIRCRELIQLTCEDVDFGEGLMRIQEGKGGYERVIPIGERALGWLKAWIRQARPHVLAKRKDPEPTDVLFLSQYGIPLDDTAINRKLKVYALRAGLEKRVTVHAFRHTLATLMLARGADLRYIQEMLGHKRMGTTQRYTHLVKKELQRVQAKAHPRDQLELPEGAIRYQGRHEMLCSP